MVMTTKINHRTPGKTGMIKNNRRPGEEKAAVVKWYLDVIRSGDRGYEQQTLCSGEVSR